MQFTEFEEHHKTSATGERVRLEVNRLREMITLLNTAIEKMTEDISIPEIQMCQTDITIATKRLNGQFKNKKNVSK